MQKTMQVLSHWQMELHVEYPNVAPAWQDALG